MSANTDRLKEEIKSIRPREYKLRLSTADVKRLYDRAIIEGTTVENLLEKFVSDLVDGTYCTGGDESDLANDYVARCNYSVNTVKTFISWLLQCGDTHDLAIKLDMLDDALEDDNIEEIECQNQKIMKYYVDYQKDGGKQDYEKALEGFKKYRAYLKERGIEL